MCGKAYVQNVFPREVGAALRVNKTTHTDRTRGGTGQRGENRYG